jgi:hypothetical protein
VLKQYKEGKSSFLLARKYNIPRKTIESWKVIEERDGALDVKTKGRQKGTKLKDYKERYEILKKYQDFLVKQEQKKR